MFSAVHVERSGADKAGHHGNCFRSREVFALLQESIEKKDLVSGRRVQSLLEKHNVEQDAYWGDHLIRLFASCGKVQEADLAFYKIKKPTTHTWNAIISAHVKSARNERGLELFSDMLHAGTQSPNKLIFLWVLKACKNLGSTWHAKIIHDSIVKCGLQSDNIISNALVDVYAKCGNFVEAHRVFDIIPNRNVVSWCALITGYAAHGKGLDALYIFEKMQEGHTVPDKMVFSSILKACGIINATRQTRMVHDQVIRDSYESDLFIGSSLVDVYARSGCLQEAQTVFDKLQNRNAVPWATLIVGYAEHGDVHRAMELLERMQQSHIDIDSFAFLSIIKACSSVGRLRQGRLLHCQMIEKGFFPDRLLSNALVDMYSRCGSLEDANSLFEKLPNRDVVSWGAMIAGYDGNGSSLLALSLFDQMQQAGVKANIAVFLPVLNSCCSLDYLEHGMLVHGQLIEQNEELVLALANKLVDMYAKIGKVEEAKSVFHAMRNRDVVSWGTMILGCADHGHAPTALDYFQRMWQECTDADKVIFLCVLKACGGTGAIKLARVIHHQIVTSGLNLDLDIGNTLVDMYAKMGSLIDARRAFDGLHIRDKVSWAAMISGYARCGGFALAGQCLKDMQHQGLQPHEGIFSSLLLACTHAGVLDEGYQFFNLMIHEYGITPSIEHYNCIIDLLGRVGQLKEAIAILATMPTSSDMIVWTSLLTSCKTYHNVDLGRICFNQVSKWDPDDASGYILMCSIYADAEMWEEVDKLRAMRKCAGAKKKRGITWVEVNNKVHEFVVGEKGPEIDDCMLLKAERISRIMKKSAYLPLLDLVLDPTFTEL
ncbi:hypothetical protein GOP47_0014006 [Adiantum capillus-veneris]|uniref:Pentatricopeptide repeat-containing protein n=1 Tax=Adiantum capillus-veneris TaxID=13818 RepID=A0A9D4ZFY0_ADICA|nr:hypothetical protein GOP47_0014006 [Adiantum capillus-veneris]